MSLLKILSYGEMKYGTNAGWNRYVLIMACIPSSSLSFLKKNVFFSWPTDLIKEYMHEEKALSLFV
jgi:hypothetical protein